MVRVHGVFSALLDRFSSQWAPTPVSFVSMAHDFVVLWVSNKLDRGGLVEGVSSVRVFVEWLWCMFMPVHKTYHRT